MPHPRNDPRNDPRSDPRSDPRILHDFLARQDVPCPACRYNLRGLRDSACPECGAGLELRVGSSDLRLGPWVVCVVSVAAPLGLNGVPAVVGTLAWLRSLGIPAGRWGSAVWTPSDSARLTVLWIMVAACGAALWWVCRRRPRFLRLGRREQWVRAGVFAATMLAVQAFELVLLAGWGR